MFYFSNENPAFYIQLKGENAGKPIKQKISNSIGINVDENLLVPDYFFYVVLHLFQSGKFTARLKGSVVPYILQSDISAVIIDFFLRSPT